MKQRILSLFLALALLFSVLPTAYAAECSITVTAPTPASIQTGELYEVALSDVFQDTDGHTLTYALKEGYGNKIYLKNNQLEFTAATADEYDIGIVATCSGGHSAEANVSITVTEAADGDALQYGYDETPQKSVRVYVTISNDGIPIVGNDTDSTVLSRVAVDVPYFSLEDYDSSLADFGRYHTEDGKGSYIDTDLVERPTLLHLYIYLLERYYIGLPAAECGISSESSSLFDGDHSGTLMDMLGNALENNGTALYITGSSTSLYMQQFWGHDENLMYYRNHVYPLMSAGWGATADYILLSDGDAVDLAMFTDWSFWMNGAFACFNKDEYTVNKGDTLSFQTLKYETSSVADGGTEAFEPVTGLNVAIYDEDWNLKNAKAVDTDNGDGSYSHTFTEPGVYYLLGLDVNCGTSDACYAPAVAKVTVLDAEGHKCTWDDGTETRAAGCETAGVMTYTCTGCGATYTEPIPATGHTYNALGVCLTCGANRQGYLSELHLSAYSSNKEDDYVLTPNFVSGALDYTVAIPDAGGSVYLRATLSENAPAGATITAKWVNLYNDTEKTASIVSGKTTGTTLTNFARDGKSNTLTLTVGAGDDVQVYTVESQRTPTLKAITLSDARLNETFAYKTTAYTADTVRDTVTVTATPYSEDYTVTYNGQSSNEIELVGGENTIVIAVANADGLKTEYTLTVIKRSTCNVSISATPEDAVVNLCDFFGDRIWPDADGSYCLMDGATYTYTVAASGYIGQQQSFTASAETTTLNVTLLQAEENTNIDTSITGDWENFRNGDDHLGITDAKTPYTPEDSELLWAAKYGSGWGGGAVASPLLVDGYLITYSGTSLKRVDTNTGAVVAEGTMVATSSFAINPPTYADGMLFVCLSGGIVQAFDAKTLESLWVYTDPIGGQPNTSPTYKDGYIYVGFWNGESKPGNFVALSVTDEDPTKTDESKLATWSYACNGGFYWAGAYVTEKLCIVGTDDGSGEGDYVNTAALLVFDRITGKLLDSHYGCKGDIRCNISHDPDSDRVFFTSKGGYLYNAQIDWETGKILDFKSFALTDANGVTSAESSNIMSTCTPSVYNGRIYLGVSGSKGQFSSNGGHCIEVIDLDTQTGEMTQAYSYAIVGYPQTSAMVSTAYEDEDFDGDGEADGYVFIYLPYNYTPGGISVLMDRPGQTEPKTASDSGYSEVFTPVSPLAQYCICSTIADSYGTIYYKNDSCYMMAITSKILDIKVTQKPDKLDYDNEVFDPTGMKVVAVLANGMERDITDYVTWPEEAIPADQLELTLTYTYGFDNANYGLKTKTTTLKLEKVKTAEVEILAQAEGAFLCAPTTTVVSADLSDKYGFADEISKYEGISALDALLRAHELVFGEAFTVETAAEFLTVTSSGYVTSMFMVETAYNGFAVNDLSPTKNEASPYGGYVGYTVADCPLQSGDSINFFLYQDTIMSCDLYTWYEQNGTITRSMTATALNPFTVSVRGYMFGWTGYLYKSYAEIAADSTNNLAVANAQLAILDPATGALTDITGAITDKNGNVTLMLDEGEYILAARSTEDSTYPNILSLFHVSVGKHVHSYTAKVTEPTCTEAGYTTHICTCGANYTDSYVDALGHDMVTDAAVAATCTKTGLTEGSHCTRCEHKIAQQETPALGHDMVTDAAVAATCTETGLTEGSHCTRCEHKIAQEEVAALGHDMVTDAAVAATCTETGLTEGSHCSRCEHKIAQQETPALGHDIVNHACTRCNYTEDCPSAEFSDLDTSRWYHEGVDFVLKNGYMAGTDKGFQPDAALTREMLAQILYAKEGKPEVTITGRFPDEDTSRWYAAAIEWAAENGYIAGYGNGNFGVGDAVTREQIAVILYAYEGKPDVGETSLDSYPDAGQVSGWARTAMVWAVENGLITGNAKGELMPKDAATRATFAVIFYAYLEK